MNKIKERVNQLQKLVDDYVEDFETIAEDDEGHEGYYQPNDLERMLINDAIHGLIEDDDFIDAVVAYHAERQAYRHELGLCSGCGAPAGTHWGKRPGCTPTTHTESDKG